MTRAHPPSADGRIFRVFILLLSAAVLSACDSDISVSKRSDGASGATGSASSSSSSSGGSTSSSSSGSGSSTSSSGSSGGSTSSSSSSSSSSGSSTSSGATFAYIANAGNNTVSICAVDELNGSLDACTVSSGNGTFNLPLAIAINSTATIAYVANFGDTLIVICPIDSQGLFGTCVTAADATFFALNGVTLSPAGDYLYTSNFNGSVSICPVMAGGSLAACASSGSMGGLLMNPQFVGFSPADPLHLYSSGSPGQQSVTICDIAPGDGSLIACTALSGSGPAPNTGFFVPEGIGFNAQGTIAYIGNAEPNGTIGNYVSICPVNADGTFGDCTITNGNGTFNFTSQTQIDLFISSAAHVGYVPNNNNNTVSLCPINPDGSLGVCAVTDGGGTFNQPSAITLAAVPGL